MLTRLCARLSSAPAVAVLACGLAFSVPHAVSAQSSGSSALTPKQIVVWERSIQDDLVAENFNELDSTADRLRAEKTRLPGGVWQLRLFYNALDVPQESEQDSLEHVTHLQNWVAARPNSVTARVALASALTRWAWVARGHGYSSTVTPEGWQLFGERMKEAQVILEGSQKMGSDERSSSCPQWYSAMLAVGIAQGWDRDRMRKVLDEGTKLEPGYFYLYSQYADYLLPKWHGHAGDASEFARTSADAVGGDAGDILYFEIGTNLIRRGDDEFPAREMDWQRLQHGYQAVIAQYGAMHGTENQLAYMAWKFQDAGVARQQFAVIGDAWNRNVWGDRNSFDRARDWSKSPTTALMPGQGQVRAVPVQVLPAAPSNP